MDALPRPPTPMQTTLSRSLGDFPGWPRMTYGKARAPTDAVVASFRNCRRVDGWPERGIRGWGGWGGNVGLRWIEAFGPVRAGELAMDWGAVERSGRKKIGSLKGTERGIRW